MRLRLKAGPRTELFVIFAAWIALIWFGFGMLWQHALTPGQGAKTGRQWPVHSVLPAPLKTPVLIVFAHPRCPCTRATISELARLMTHCGSRLTACVLFYKPASSVPGWEQTDTYARATHVPGVQVRCDVDGAEAKRFGAFTSGQCLLFARNGALLFQGGITSARGHEGDSEGHSAILQAVLRGTAFPPKTPVFGCSLFSSQIQ